MLTFRSRECFPKFSSSKIKLDFMRGQYFSTFWRKLTKPKKIHFLSDQPWKKKKKEKQTPIPIRRRQRQTGDKV